MFEFEAPTVDLTMEDMTVKVLDPNGVKPSTIIQHEDAWKIKVDWTMGGSALDLLGGQWIVECYYESLGGGPEGKFPDANPNEPVHNNPDDNPDYTHTINVPAQYLPVNTYRLVTIISHRNGDLTETQAISEGPTIRIYRHD